MSKMRQVCFLSNYINHHQIPFCNAMSARLGEGFVFLQTMEMESQRKEMGWDAQDRPAYVHCCYEEEAFCRERIERADVVLFGGVADETYIAERLKQKKPVIRVDERMYKEGQWKAVSPRGLLKKYKDHTSRREDPVYFLCAGAYVADDLRLIRAYDGKKFCWGYFPPVKRQNIDRLMEKKRKDVPLLLWAGRFLDWKHPELALGTAAYLKERGLRFRLVMIGGGEPAGALHEKCRALGLEDQVEFVGYQPPDVVRDYMEQADIFLLTSDRREGWGAVANEAMNSACALVADHMTGAAPYLIRQGENGFCYRSGNREMLFRQVERLLREDRLRSRIARAAYETITELWNGEYAAEKLLTLIEDVVLQNKRVYPAKEGAVFAPCAPAPAIPERKMFAYLTRKE